MKYLLSVIFFCLFLVSPTWAFPDSNLSSSLAGKILLNVEDSGKAWYVYPGDFHRYYLGKPDDAYNVMRNLSLGISNMDFLKIASNTPDRFKGLILLKVEDAGKAYYVTPEDKTFIYLKNGLDALSIMREYSLGITDTDLKTIPTVKITTDSAGIQVSREWQYLGWWGKINKNYIPVLQEPRADSKRKGFLYFGDTIKVLAVEKGERSTWYKIDGGRYPGGYINSLYLYPIAQPASEIISSRPINVLEGDYWTDLNLTKKVLTLFKDDQPVMATYISGGLPASPTIIGTYNVWLKLDKTRMRGAPPLTTHAYDLPDVPWVMYYKGSYSIHGTYWHDNFGTQRSAGCTNMTQGDAKFIFDLTKPDMKGEKSVRSSFENIGMVVNNHY